jgi:hypothetical protein
MSERITIQLDPRQREYLLDGLRYVRSSVALEIIDWSEEVENQRQRQYEDLDRLEDMLNGVTSGQKAAHV